MRILFPPRFSLEAIRALVAGARAETSIVGLALTAGTAVLEPAPGAAKRENLRLRMPVRGRHADPRWLSDL